MTMKVKYVGSGEAGVVTLNQVYTVLSAAVAGHPLVIIDDNGAPYTTVQSFGSSHWDVDSVVGSVQIYP